MGKNKIYESNDDDTSDEDEDFGSSRSCFPSGGAYRSPYWNPSYGPPKPDLTESLLQALIESHKNQIQTLMQMFMQQQHQFAQMMEPNKPKA